MKNHNLPSVKSADRYYIFPIPVHLTGKTVDQIFEDSKHCYGLMSIFFKWTGKLLRKGWPGSKLIECEFEDSFHEAFEKLVMMRIADRVKAVTAVELYTYLRETFKNIVIQKLKEKGKERTLFVNKIEFEDVVEYTETYVTPNLLHILDMVIRQEDILSPKELIFWDIFKLKPDKKEVIMQTLNISSENYDTTKHRVVKKVNSLPLKDILF